MTKQEEEEEKGEEHETREQPRTLGLSHCQRHRTPSAVVRSSHSFISYMSSIFSY